VIAIPTGLIAMLFSLLFIQRFFLSREYALKRSVLNDETCPIITNTFTYKGERYLLAAYLLEREKFFIVHYKSNLRRKIAKNFFLAAAKISTAFCEISLWSFDLDALGHIMQSDTESDALVNESDRRWYRGGVLSESTKPKPTGAILALLAGLLSVTGVFLNRGAGQMMLVSGIAIGFGTDNAKNERGLYRMFAKAGIVLGVIGCVFSLLTLFFGNPFS